MTQEFFFCSFSEDGSICPVLTAKEYICRTEALRKPS